MKCDRTDCFAYNPAENNNCSALTKTKGCKFYKTVETMKAQEDELKEGGHPVYRPSVTRQDQRILKALLNGKRMDQTGQENT